MAPTKRRSLRFFPYTHGIDVSPHFSVWWDVIASVGAPAAGVASVPAPPASHRQTRRGLAGLLIIGLGTGCTSTPLSAAPEGPGRCVASLGIGDEPRAGLRWCGGVPAYWCVANAN